MIALLEHVVSTGERLSKTVGSSKVSMTGSNSLLICARFEYEGAVFCCCCFVLTKKKGAYELIIKCLESDKEVLKKVYKLQAANAIVYRVEKPLYVEKEVSLCELTIENVSSELVLSIARGGSKAYAVISPKESAKFIFPVSQDSIPLKW